MLLIDLIFLSNELLSPRRHRDLRVPLEFITFAYVHGKLYHHFRKSSTFVVPKNGNTWGNDVVYGALFLLKDFHYYIRTLDAYQSCSLSVLSRNHPYDLHHRISTQATPITFSDVDEFSSLRYHEKPDISSWMYVGNPTHPNLARQLTGRRDTKRIVDGLDKRSFLELTREVLT